MCIYQEWKKLIACNHITFVHIKLLFFLVLCLLFTTFQGESVIEKKQYALTLRMTSSWVIMSALFDLD